MRRCTVVYRRAYRMRARARVRVRRIQRLS